MVLVLGASLSTLVAPKPKQFFFIALFPVILPLGTLVVNIGDVVEAWTRGRYRATMHRVKNSASRHRISAPFFFQPGLDSFIKPLDDVISTENGDETSSTRLVLNKPFLFGDYVANKFENSYGNN